VFEKLWIEGHLWPTRKKTRPPRGPIKVPDEILHKPGHLNEQEMTIMKDHVYYATKELTEMQVPDSIVKTIGQHHERLDGYGYPEGLRVNQGGALQNKQEIMKEEVTMDRRNNEK
jgi:hypothetical protein